MRRRLLVLCVTGIACIVANGCVKRVEQSTSGSPTTSEIVVDKQEFMKLAKVRIDSHDSAMAQSRFISPVINTGDQLTLVVYEKLPASQDKRIEIKRVSETGAILLPPVGILQVGGHTISEAAQIIEEKLSAMVVSPFCEVEITQRGYQPHYFVFGEVGSSGTYSLKPGDRLLDAISSAGGCGSQAYRRSIKLVRLYDRKVGILSINLLDILQDGKLADNITLQDQDIVFVPRRFLTNYNEILNTIGTIVPWYFFIKNF